MDRATSKGPRTDSRDSGGLRVVIDRRVGRSLEEAFIRRRVGRFSAVHCSASSASPKCEPQVRAMSIMTIPAQVFFPTADIYETQGALTVILEMPGVEKSNV